MKNGIILCEGSTDYVLLQYYMRRVFEWKDDDERQKNVFKIQGQKSRKLFREDSSLTIAATGGCSRMGKALEEVLKKNQLEDSAQGGMFSSVVVVTDNDETETVKDFLEKTKAVLKKFAVSDNEILWNNRWAEFEMYNFAQELLKIRILVMIIPFDENGAMESFLLRAVAENDAYDAGIIQNCENFINTTDIKRKYLIGRRRITKAKFDAFFCVRTAAEQFNQRQDILKSVPWEQYSKVQKDFALLREL